ncbi:MAG: vWA domain-containing protein [archaeon]
MAHQVMRANQPLQVTFLLKLFNDAGPKPDVPLFMVFLLDSSGSMSEDSGDGKRSKIDVLKESLGSSLSLLKKGKDAIMQITFSTKGCTEVLVNPMVMPDIKEIKSKIEEMVADGNTHMSTGMKMALEADSPVPDGITRVVVFTDGNVNDPGEDSEASACKKLAKQANRPLMVFGTGVAYNPQLLQELVELAGKGSYYLHVQQTGEVKEWLRREIQALQDIGARDVNIVIEAAGSAKILDAVHLIPDQLVLGSDVTEVDDYMQALDVRGQNYLISMGVSPSSAGDVKVANIKVEWKEDGKPMKDDIPVIVRLTENEEELSPTNPTVMKTFLTATAVGATLRGNLDLAETLFTHAGVGKEEEVMKTLRTLKKGQGDKEDLKRTLHTQAKTIHQKNK